MIPLWTVRSEYLFFRPDWNAICLCINQLSNFETEEIHLNHPQAEIQVDLPLVRAVLDDEERGKERRGRLPQERLEDQVLGALDIELHGVDARDALAEGEIEQGHGRHTNLRALVRPDDLQARFPPVAGIHEQGEFPRLVGDRAGHRLDRSERILSDVVGQAVEHVGLRLDRDVAGSPDITEQDVRAVLGRSSIPPPAPAARAAVDLAARRIGSSAGEGLPTRWADAVADAARPSDADLADELDQAVLRTSLRGRKPLWWAVLGPLQVVLALAALLQGLHHQQADAHAQQGDGADRQVGGHGQSRSPSKSGVER